MQIIVETKGAFGLLCPYTLQYIRPVGPTLVGMNSFMSERIAGNQLTLLASNIRVEATDKEFLVYMAESKPATAKGDTAKAKAQALAIASFASNFANEDPAEDDAIDPAEDETPDEVEHEDPPEGETIPELTKTGKKG